MHLKANLAVDNALERLISNPKIRAIRLGSAKKIDSSVSNTHEGNVFVVSGILNAFKNLLTYRDELMFGKDTFLVLKSMIISKYMNGKNKNLLE